MKNVISGYCSNAPSRCDLAKSLDVIVSLDGSCPECGMALIPTKNHTEANQSEQKILYLSLSIMVFLLLGLTYLFFNTNKNDNHLTIEEQEKTQNSKLKTQNSKLKTQNSKL